MCTIINASLRKVKVWMGDKIRITMDLKYIGINTRNSAEDRDYWRALVNAALKLKVL